jgi:SAM-dependent methyltransferase
MFAAVRKLTDGGLILGVLLILALLGFLVYLARGHTYLFVILALLLLPNVLAFVKAAFVPTSMETAKKMVEAAGLKPGETAYDLGCGDGRIVYLAAELPGVKSTGFELSLIVYLLARVRKSLWRSKAAIKFGDLRLQNLSGADVVFCYLSNELIREQEQKFKTRLKKGARVVSHDFQLTTWKETNKLVFVDPATPSGKSTIWVYQNV